MASFNDIKDNVLDTATCVCKNATNRAASLAEQIKIKELYYKLLSDLKAGNRTSPVYEHHVDFVSANHYAAKEPYIETEPNQIVIDYLASMTDDYCTELYKFLFPKSSVEFKYHGYFEDLI